MPTAYSYKRFSSKKQEQGESLNRQKEAAEKFLKGHEEYVLSDDTFTDLGVSAYKGKNKDAGALSLFIDAVEAGKVEEGSLLIIESVDRLSRLPPTEAKALFNRILDKGVKIAITRFGVIFDKQTVNFDLGSDLLLTCSIHLAHQESLQKSERVRSTIHKRQLDAAQGGEKRTKIAPFWLELSEDRKVFNLKEDESKVVQNLFDRKQSGDSMTSLVGYMNNTGIKPPRSQHWTVDSVRRILTHKGCIGILSSKSTVLTDEKKDVVSVKEISNYYPPVVTEEAFYAVQKIISKTQQSKSKGGRKGNYINLFRGMAFCGCCGDTMQSKTGWKAGRTYLRCYSQLNKSGACHAKNSVRYWEFEPILLRSLSVLDYSKFDTEDTLELQRKKDAVEGKLEALKGQKKNLIKLVKDVGEDDPEIVDEIKDLNEQIKVLSEEARGIEIEEKVATSPVTYEEFEEQIKQLDIGTPEQRERFNSFLHRFIDRLEFFENYLLIHLKGYGFPLIHLLDESYNPAAFSTLVSLHKPQSGLTQEEHTQWLLAMMLDDSAPSPDDRFEHVGEFVEDHNLDFSKEGQIVIRLTLKPEESGNFQWGKYKEIKK